MGKFIFATTAVAAITLMGGAAQAMPMPSTSGSTLPGITLVADGCGPYAHRGDDGDCHRNRGPAVFGVPIFGGERHDGYDRRDEFRRRERDRRRFEGQGDFRRHQDEGDSQDN